VGVFLLFSQLFFHSLRFMECTEPESEGA